MQNKVPMTPVMLKLLNFIRKYVKKNKYCPTYQEMADGLNYRSKNSITVLVDNSLYNIGSSAIVKEGFQKNTGFLNDNLQRVFDSDYYQYFSYALKSTVQLEKWDEAVSSLNHTAGFKKFSDLIVRSETDVGVSTVQDETKFEVINDLISIMDMNTVFDFDLALHYD